MLCNKVGEFYFVPYLLSKGIAPYFIQDPVLLHTLHACSWALYLLLHIAARTAAAVAHSIRSLHDRLRDEAFLVGVVLKNSADHASDAGLFDRQQHYYCMLTFLFD
jgi:hypothetical protein